ncbi:MAG: Sec-independent protein translocase protein TatB [Candidatus Accumulibacter sp.]|jgi:sec-independent protein translocase protein TatB|nr:Sec-independent protein translocase protein TatB [Accumulibacter sp.]
MFDIGFSELIIIGVVALVVIGPERLPRAARTAGLLLGRLQRYVSDVKADIGREMQLEDLKKLQAEVRQAASDFEHGVIDEAKALEQSIERTADALGAGVETPGAPVRDDRGAASGPAAPESRLSPE